MKTILLFACQLILISITVAQVGTVYEDESAIGELNFSNDVPTTAYLTLEWVSPYVSGLPAGRTADNTSGVVECRVKATTSATLGERNFSILRNDRPYTPEGKFRKAEFNLSTFEYRVSVGLLEGENRIKLIVQNAAGRKESKELVVNFRPAKPNLYVLAVGPSTDLQFASQDAEDFASMMESQPMGDQGIFGRIQVESILEHEATQGEILQSIERYSVLHSTENMTSRDVIILFFSTHGRIHNGNFFLQAEGYKPGLHRSTAVDFGVVQEILSEIPCKKIIFIDACQSGGARSANAAEINQAVEVLNRSQGMSVLVSSTANELSYEDTRWQNGAFTEAILSGINGGAADGNGDNIVTIGELSRHVNRAVPRMVREVKNKDQHPRLLDNNLEEVGIFLVD